MIYYFTAGEKEVRCWTLYSGSLAPQAAGKYRQEGKTYVVKDGDIIHFQFNVTAPKKK